MSADWTEKYRPKTLSDIVGNPTAVNNLVIWAKSWAAGNPKTKAAVLMGTPGIGKTTASEALARDMGWDIIEMNASDQRTGDAIRDTALRGAFSNTFGEDGEFLTSKEGKRKLIVLDEADNLFGNADRGAMPAINELIKTTKQPVLLIVNDFYELSRKSSAIKSDTTQINFMKPSASAILKALRKICVSEGIDADEDALQIIADNSNGDVRAAVRDLQSVCAGRQALKAEDTSELSNRIIKKNVYDLMSATFRKNDPFGARKMMYDIDEEPRTLLLWVDENLPYEYRNPGDLVRGYDKLSRADIFLGRVTRRQYFGLWSYAGDMMIAGVAAAKYGNYVNRDRIRFPMYLMKMSRSKGIRAVKASLCQKLADYTHNSTKRIALDVLDPIKKMFINNEGFRLSLVNNAGLDADEIGFLLNDKSDSKRVKDILAKCAEQAKAQPKKKEVIYPDLSDLPLINIGKPEPVEEKKEPEPPKEEKPAERPHGQRSLFDF